jgi:cold shock CspA family protein
MCDLLLPEAAPALAKGLHQAVAVSLWNTASLLGIAEDLRQQVLNTMPRDHHPHSSKGGWMQHRPGPYQYAPAPAADYGYKGGGHWDAKGYGKNSKNGKKGGAEYRGGPTGDLGYGGDQQSAGPFEGIVKTIKRAEEGHAHTHGFVDCSATNQIYGRDVFLHSQQAQELQVGNRVRFEVMVNQKGMPQAHNLVVYS